MSTIMDFDYATGYRAQFEQTEDGFSVAITADNGDTWRKGALATFDEAVKVAGMIYRDRLRIDEVARRTAFQILAPDLAAKDEEIRRLKQKIRDLETEYGKRQ